MVQLLRTDFNNKDFIALVALLDAELAFRDGDDHAFYAQFNKTVNLKNAVVAFYEGDAVASGAFRPYDTGAVEIKRMFVKPAFRGKGIAGIVLKELENWAAELDYTAAVLETGQNQPEAISLYQRSGYVITPNYGQYEGVYNSVCMRKSF